MTEIFSDEQIEANAVAKAKEIKKTFAREFTDTSLYLPEKYPVSVFMAGSPGAGKTESSIEIINSELFKNSNVLRIDSDEFRQEFENYDGRNSHLFQGATSILVEKILDMAFDNQQSFLLDGTLTNYEKAKDNIKRSLKKERYVLILYVYQEPHLAWNFVQKREELEGRRIAPEVFISQYFTARDVVNRLKAEFGADVHVDLLLKNNDNSNRTTFFNVQAVDLHIPERFTQTELERILNPS